MRRIALVLTLAACSKQPAHTRADAGSGPELLLARQREALALIAAWSNALDHKDRAALDKVYADGVLFYGVPRERSEVTRWHTAGASLAYRHSIARTLISEDGRHATFDEQDTHGPQWREWKAELGLDGRPLRITEVIDPPPAHGTCEEVVNTIVWSHSQTKAAVEDLKKTLDATPDLYFGQIRYAGMQDHTPYGEIGTHSPASFNGVIRYRVEQGLLYIRQYPNDFFIDPADAEKVKATCVKKEM